MVLSDRDILKNIEANQLVIHPFDANTMLNPNSVDLTLNPKGLVYNDDLKYLDCRESNDTYEFIIPDEGVRLYPGEFYLFSVNERVEINSRIICGDVLGKSSLGRLGMQIHMTAGFIDTGFTGNITLEVIVQKPLKIYPNIPVCQIRFEKLTSSVITSYKEKKNSKYVDSIGTIASRMHQNF